MCPDKPTALECASTIRPESADFNVCECASKCLTAMTIPATDHVMLPETDHVTSEKLMPAFSIEPTILPFEDSVLKIDVFGTAGGSFLDDETTRFGVWAMFKIVVLSVLLFFSFARCEHCLGDFQAPAGRDSNIDLSTELQPKATQGCQRVQLQDTLPY